MRDTLVHRGPDSDGIWWSEDNRVGLAHRRLAIIDLSEYAAQPMLDLDENTIICFNGEIHNFLEIRGTLEAKGIQLPYDSLVIIVLMKVLMQNW